MSQEKKSVVCMWREAFAKTCYSSHDTISCFGVWLRFCLYEPYKFTDGLCRVHSLHDSHSLPTQHGESSCSKGTA